MKRFLVEVKHGERTMQSWEYRTRYFATRRAQSEGKLVNGVYTPTLTPIASVGFWVLLTDRELPPFRPLP